MRVGGVFLRITRSETFLVQITWTGSCGSVTAKSCRMTSSCSVTEDQLQRLVVQWLELALPPGCLFHHSPNEGTRHVNYKVRLKQLGTKFGWPDLEILVPGDASLTGMSFVVFIELKRPKGGSLNANQRAIRDQVLDAGAYWGMARSVDQVRDILEPLVRLRAS